MFFKQIFAVCFKDIKFPSRATSETEMLYNLSLLFTTKFSFAHAHSKTRILLFLTFQDEGLNSQNESNETKPDKKLSEYNKRN